MFRYISRKKLENTGYNKKIPTLHCKKIRPLQSPSIHTPSRGHASSGDRKPESLVVVVSVVAHGQFTGSYKQLGLNGREKLEFDFPGTRPI